MCIKTKDEINSLSELQEIMKNYSNDKFVFRGQANCDWELKSSLYRQMGLIKDINRLSIENIKIKEDISDEKLMTLYENNVIKIYKSHENLYRNIHREKGQSIDENKINILPILQHYSSPTRLIDWSYSPYIATYFAVNSYSENDACLFIINYKHIKVCNLKNYSSLVDSGSRGSDINPLKILEAAKYNGVLVDFYTPDETNDRLSRQQGLFLIPSMICKSVEDILLSETYEKNKKNGDVILKFIIKKECKTAILKELNLMNISADTLFPELEGFCKSLIYRNVI
jgi:hypothetical protein